MAFNITSESQLIDIETIKKGCDNLKTAINDLKLSGETVVRAGGICNEKALSIDNQTMEYTISELGQEMIETKNLIDSYADTLYADAIQKYNNQVGELNDYYRYLEEQNRQQNQQNQQNGNG